MTKPGCLARHYRTRTYVAWSSMKTRCYNAARPEWKRYGGRGITVCDRWRDDYFALLAAAGESRRVIAHQFNVNKSTITRVVNGLRWAGV